MPRPKQDRVKVSFYAKQSALDEVAAAATAEGVADRSEMLRRLLGLGLGVWKAQQQRKAET